MATSAGDRPSRTSYCSLRMRSFPREDRRGSGRVCVPAGRREPRWAKAARRLEGLQGAIGAFAPLVVDAGMMAALGRRLLNILYGWARLGRHCPPKDQIEAELINACPNSRRLTGASSRSTRRDRERLRTFGKRGIEGPATASLPWLPGGPHRTFTPGLRPLLVTSASASRGSPRPG